MISHWSEPQRNCLRLALTISFSMLLALLIGWPGSFLMAIIASQILCAGGPPMAVKQGLGLIAATFVLLNLGQLFTVWTLHYPLVCVTLLLMFTVLGQYGGLSGKPALLVLIFFLAFLVLPLLGMASPILVDGIVGGLFTSISLGVFCSWLSFGLIPYRGDSPTAAAAPSATELLAPAERCRIAVLRTLLVLPVLLMFYLLEMTGDVLILIFVMILIQMPSAEVGRKQGTGLLAANALGGLAAVVIFNLLTIAPTPITLALLVFVACLLFGQRIFSDHPMAALYSSGLNTIIVIIGSTTGTLDAEAGDKIWTRLFQIAAAVVYVITVLAMLENYRQRRAQDDTALATPK